MSNTLQYSAEVEIYLDANGKRVEVASCLDNKLILRNPTLLPAGDAKLIIAIDGVSTSQEVVLKDDITEDSSVIFLDFV